MTKTTPPTGLALLREPFPAHQISQLPKITCKSCSNAPSRVCDQHKKARCSKCEAWITSAHVDLSYVGHAALTDRLLEADLAWTWEPVAWDEQGLPAFDRLGGLWIRLTVNGVTRLGYGDAQGKTGNNAVKEAIGDGLRNAAMRFGAALDLWHKGELHADEDQAFAAEHKALTEKVLDDPKKAERGVPADDPWAAPIVTDSEWMTDWIDRVTNAPDVEALKPLWAEAVGKNKAGLINPDDFDVLTSVKNDQKQTLAGAAA